MRFNVPQFIDIKPKIFGPFTLFQFIWVVVGGVFLFIFWKIFKAWVFLLIGIPMFAFWISLVVVSVNKRPLGYLVLSFIRYLLSPKIYTWKK